MIKVELVTSWGAYVATVEIPRTRSGSHPVVLLWGSRVFHRVDSVGPYTEVGTVVSLTESPGLPRDPRCTDVITDGDFRRPCELHEGHEGGHRYTVITATNMEALRVKRL